MQVLDLREVTVVVRSLEETAAGSRALTGDGGRIGRGFGDHRRTMVRRHAVGNRYLTFRQQQLTDHTEGLSSCGLIVGDIEEAEAHLRSLGACLSFPHPIVLHDVVFGQEHVERLRINVIRPGPLTHGLCVELQELTGVSTAVSAIPAAEHSPLAINEVFCAVYDVEEAAAELAALLGLQVGAKVVQGAPPQEVVYRNLFIGSRSVLAIVQGTTASSAIGRFLDARGEGMFSVSIRVADGPESAAWLQANEIELVSSEPSVVAGPRVGHVRVDHSALLWVKPQAALGKVLYELQAYEPPESGSPQS